MNSFELPQQSHRLLPVPSLQIKKHSQNAQMAQSKSITSSNQILPTLKHYLEAEDNTSSTKVPRSSGLTQKRIETQQFERSKLRIKDANATPQMSNLEKNK